MPDVGILETAKTSSSFSKSRRCARRRSCRMSIDILLPQRLEALANGLGIDVGAALDCNLAVT